MRVTNNNRSYYILPIYGNGTVTLEDAETHARFQFPLHIAFSYQRTAHAQISPLRT